MQSITLTRGSFTISTDKTRLDLDAIHHFLCEVSYWAQGRTREVVEQSIQNSLLCFGVYDGENQVGFARLVTDGCTFAWLCDVYILEAYRGQGLGKWLIQTVVAHPQLAKMRNFVLATRDAHGLYQQYGGFVPFPHPERWMLRPQPPA